MKALSLISIVFALFLIFLGVSSRKTAGNVLSNVVILGGTLIVLLIVIIRIIMFIKEKKEKEADLSDSDSE